jgi:hypothetical protein
MSFWSDSSAIVKGAIVVGVIGVLVSIMAYAGIGPFATDSQSEDSQATEQRGL